MPRGAADLLLCARALANTGYTAGLTVPQSASLIFSGLAIGSYVAAEVAAEIVHRRNLKRTGIGGGTLYARAVGVLAFVLFTVCAVVAFHPRPH
jgi:hypothetical protein